MKFGALKAVLSLGIGLLIGFGFMLHWATASSSSAQALSPKESTSATWPSIQLNLYSSGFNRPVQIANAGDGSGRMFVVEQVGRIIIVQSNLSKSTFLDISGRVNSPANGGGNEQGLLSVAFPPNYSSKGYFYVYYTKRDGNNVVSRFRLTANPNVADPAGEEPILLLEHPTYDNHNGGQLAFGPDGYLYIGTGDGGGGGDPFGNAQDPGSLLGKILRIDVEFSATPPVSGYTIYLPYICKQGGTSTPYLIPPDNPFANTLGYRPEIWAMGMRNPWRFSFDRQTNDLFIGDVGQNQWEEVDFQPASSNGGENYGWNIREGNHCYNPSSGCVSPNGYVAPVAEYNHGTNDSTGCSISGGFVYRGTAFPALQGIYFYSDYCTGRIWGLQYDNGWQSQELLDSNHSVSTFGEDEAGNLFLTDLASGEVYQLAVAP